MLKKIVCISSYCGTILLSVLQVNAQKIMEENFKDNSKSWFVADDEKMCLDFLKVIFKSIH